MNIDVKAIEPEKEHILEAAQEAAIVKASGDELAVSVEKIFTPAEQLAAIAALFLETSINFAYNLLYFWFKKKHKQ